MDVGDFFSEKAIQLKKGKGPLPSGVFSLDEKPSQKKSLAGEFLEWINKVQNLNQEAPSSMQAKEEFFIPVKKGEEKNIYIQNSDEPPAPSRFFLFLDEGSSLKWVENESSSMSEVFILAKEGSSVFILKMGEASSQKPPPAIPHSFVFCDLKKEASFFSLDINSQAASRRTKIEEGEKTVCLIRGLNILSGKEQASHFIEHHKNEEGSYSRHLYRNILSGRAKNTVHSQITVKAQNTDSNQMIQNLLLSPYAKAKNQPELIIKKDQVKASHGSTTGRLNPSEIFYLISRGLSKKKAVEFLVTGWAHFILQNSPADEEKLKAPIKNFQKKIRKPIEKTLEGLIQNILKTAEDFL